MDVYAPASTLGWLDFDAAASERVATLLRSLKEPATLDVLGLGTIRDAFSNMLSPGTSTIQTRLRYVIFLPWIFKRLEDERVPAADFARRLRDDEAQLIDCLRHLGPNQGVIGFRAGRDLRRMPSDVYWGILAAWGISRLPLSLAEYGARAASLGRLRPARDDDGNATTRGMSMWAAIPAPPEDFLQANITFELREDEAQLVVDRIRQSQPDTLLGSLCQMPGPQVDVAFPWELPARGLPARVVEVLRHARCFSELTLGPQLVYNLLVAQEAAAELRWNTEKVIEGEQRKLEEWAKLVETRSSVFCAWIANMSEFWSVVAGHTIKQSTRRFVEEIARHAIDDPSGFKHSSAVASLIRGRELRLKGKRARLSHRSALENWHRDPVGGQFEYRWAITKSYLNDIAAALSPSDASARRAVTAHESERKGS